MEIVIRDNDGGGDLFSLEIYDPVLFNGFASLNEGDKVELETEERGHFFGVVYDKILYYSELTGEESLGIFFTNIKETDME